MATATTVKKETRVFTKKNNAESPRKLSKIGEFLRKYPNGIGYIVDHKAVLK